jgi:hemoglobin
MLNTSYSYALSLPPLGAYLLRCILNTFLIELEKNMSQQESLYEKLGGEAAVNAAVDIFYRKVLSDDRISSFFEDVDMEKQAAKQKAFLTMAFGGPHNYSGLDMRAGHAHLVERGLDDTHVDAVIENLAATLRELGVQEALINQVAAIAESTRNDVLGR